MQKTVVKEVSQLKHFNNLARKMNLERKIYGLGQNVGFNIKNSIITIMFPITL